MKLLLLYEQLTKRSWYSSLRLSAWPVSCADTKTPSPSGPWSVRWRAPTPSDLIWARIVSYILSSKCASLGTAKGVVKTSGWGKACTNHSTLTSSFKAGELGKSRAGPALNLPFGPCHRRGICRTVLLTYDSCSVALSGGLKGALGKVGSGAGWK